MARPDFAPRRSWRAIASLTLRSLRLVWRAAPREFAVTAAVQLVVAVGTGAAIFVVRASFASMTAAKPTLEAVLVPLAVFMGVGYIMDAGQAVAGEKTRILGELVTREAIDGVIRHAANVELISFEDASFHDQLERAHAHGQLRGLQVAQGFVALAGSAIGAATILAAVAFLQPILLAVVVIAGVPLWVISVRNGRDIYEVAFSLTAADRRRGYLQHLLLSRDTAQEIRVLDAASFIHRLYARLYDERVAELRGLVRRRIARRLTGSALASTAGAAGLGILAFLYIRHELSLPTAAASAFAFSQLAGRLRALQTAAGSLYEAALFVRDYESFIDTDSQLPVAPRSAPIVHVEVDSASFSYPGRVERALADITLEVGRGEVVALVGENGSGKTTLAKLVAGLFTPDSGSVTWRTAGSVKIDRNQARDQIGVVFQDYSQFALRAFENIGIGRQTAIGDRAGIVEAAIASNADRYLRQLEYGYDTMLGSEFDSGTDLSVGQWQRIALARAIFRRPSLLILDEPAASLDARAESQMYAVLRAEFATSAVLLVSHRLATVRGADRIYVLRRGQIVETGSHDDLIGQGGLYADLFRLQAAGFFPEVDRSSATVDASIREPSMLPQTPDVRNRGR